MRATLRAWLARRLATSEPISDVRMTEAWLAMGFSSRTGLASPARSASQAGSTKAKLMVSW